MQGVLPTMIILAVYYTIADIVLLGQCFYYRGFTLSDTAISSKPQPSPLGHYDVPTTEHTALLSPSSVSPARRHSFADSLAHLSPATPLLDATTSTSPDSFPPTTPRSPLKAFLFNTSFLLLVCLAGVIGWYLSSSSSSHHTHQHRDRDPQPQPITFSPLGQVFGYLCAILYLGSRIPQLLLNARRKSTEGVSMLFFLFACVGNLTYVLSILAYEPICGRERRAQEDVMWSTRLQRLSEAATMWRDTCEEGEMARLYARYIAVNASWLLGSFGTLALDAGIFVQFWMYRKREEESEIERRCTNGDVVLLDEG